MAHILAVIDIIEDLMKDNNDITEEEIINIIYTNGFQYSTCRIVYCYNVIKNKIKKNNSIIINDQ
jgi:hypothetical protein